ncbi:MAG: adenosine kinase [Bacteroidales bacterium]|nr:adenosine kinase [Bacteroidales bacterium]
MKRILGIGNALVDVITFLKDDSLLKELSLPKGSMQLVDALVSEKIGLLTSKLNRHLASGGSAANTIHGLAKLGVETGFIGAVGTDKMGDFFQEDMKKAGIATFMLKSRQPTGLAISLVSHDGERTFATYLGAATDIISKELNSSVFLKYDHLHLEGYLVQDHNLITTAVRLAKSHNMTVSLDLASYNVVEANLEFLHDLVSRYIDIVFANEQEARSFTSLEDPVDALRQIASICRTSIVKTGGKGSWIMHDGALYRAGIIDVRCIDTTGAGDLYATGFIYGIIKGFKPDLCGETGALLAGKVIEEPGAKISPAGWDYIYEILDKEFLEGPEG